MKATVDVEAFNSAWSIVASIVPGKSPKAILQNVLFTVTEDGAFLMGTNLEQGVRRRLIGVKAEEPGTCVLPTTKVAAIMRASSDKEVVIEHDGDKLRILGTHADYKLTVEDPTLFPDVPVQLGKHVFEVEPAELRKMIRRTRFACDPESTRYALGGALWELDTREVSKMSMVCTDGRRLARMTGAVVWPDDEKAKGPSGAPVVPQSALRLIDRMLDGETTAAKFSLDDKALCLHTFNTEIYSRLVEGRFPKYQDVFPSIKPVKIPLSAAPFLASVRQAEIVTSDESKGVDFHFGVECLVMQSQSADIGSSRIEHQIAFMGPPVDITFDPHYLSEALATLEPGTDVVMELIDAKQAAVMKTDDGYTYVVMPLTREK